MSEAFSACQAQMRWQYQAFGAVLARLQVPTSESTSASHIGPASAPYRWRRAKKKVAAGLRHCGPVRRFFLPNLVGKKKARRGFAPRRHRLYSYGLCSYGLYSYGLLLVHSYGLYSYGRYSYAYIVMADMVMACIGVAYSVMAYIVMTLYGYGLSSHGLYSYGPFVMAHIVMAHKVMANKVMAPRRRGT